MLNRAGLFLRLELVEARQGLVLVNKMTIDFRAIDTGVACAPFCLDITSLQQAWLSF